MEIGKIVTNQRELIGMFTKWANDMAKKEEEFVSTSTLWQRCREDSAAVGREYALSFIRRLAAFAEEKSRYTTNT